MMSAPSSTPKKPHMGAKLQMALTPKRSREQLGTPKTKAKSAQHLPTSGKDNHATSSLGDSKTKSAQNLPSSAASDDVTKSDDVTRSEQNLERIVEPESPVKEREVV